jgi:hypothetical protein
MPNVVVEGLALLLHIREVPSLNLGPETCHTDSVSWFFSAPPGKYREIRQRPLPSTSLPTHHSFVIHSRMETYSFNIERNKRETYELQDILNSLY